MERLTFPQLAEQGWSAASQFVPTSAIVKAQEAVQQCLAQRRFRYPPAEVLDGLLGAVGSSQIAEFQAAEEPAGFDQADGVLTQAAGRVPRAGSLQGRTRAVLHQAGVPMPLAAPELSEAECCRWLGIFSRRRYTIVLFLGPDRAQLCLEQVEASESGDEEEVEEIEMSLPLALASSSAPSWCMSSRWRRVVVTLFAVFCSAEGGPLEEQNEQQCLHLDGYPGRCPIYIMKGACYSDQEGVAWACMTETCLQMGRTFRCSRPEPGPSLPCLVAPVNGSRDLTPGDRWRRMQTFENAVVHRSEEEDIPPLSLSGVWRSVAVQLEVYKERPAPSCAFSLVLLTWVAALYRILRTDFPPPGPAGLCMDPAAVRFAQGFEAKRWLLHALWPLEPGYLRGFLSSSLLLVLGYSLEYELGSAHFCGLLLGLQIGAAFLLLHFRFSMCVISLEPAMAGLAVIAHRVNPKVHSDGLGAALKLPFEVEPRWHIWVLLGLLLMQAGDFPNALVVHAAGLLLGAVVVMREPEVWGDAWRALVGRSFTCGAVAHIVLFVFTIVFMPLTVPEAPADMLALFQAALADGRLFKLSWWRDSIPSSLPLLHMAISGQLGGEALYICRFLLSIALPLLLSSMRMWAVAQEGLCFASGSFE
ncbi:unnamed protein product [Symbiodinium sp. CCMP2456]|nr:unnamed protein product [Symbiodinium sp. CCMP2456]